MPDTTRELLRDIHAFLFRLPEMLLHTSRGKQNSESLASNLATYLARLDAAQPEPQEQDGGDKPCPECGGDFAWIRDSGGGVLHHGPGGEQTSPCPAVVQEQPSADLPPLPSPGLVRRCICQMPGGYHTHSCEREYTSTLRRSHHTLHAALTAERKARVDARECCKPEWDGTEGACPAWWRGSDRGWEAAQARLAEAEGLLREWRRCYGASVDLDAKTSARLANSIATDAFLSRKPDGETPPAQPKAADAQAGEVTA